MRAIADAIGFNLVVISPTKPFSPGSPIEANEVNKNIPA